MSMLENPIEALLRDLESFFPKEQYINPEDNQWQVTVECVRHDERRKMVQFIKEWNEANLKQ